MENVILKKPWVIIAAWLIIVIVSGPLAASINDIVKTSEEQFLPSTAESIRASNAMENLSTGPSRGEMPGFLVVVGNVPVTLDSYWKLKPWYTSLKEKHGEKTFSSWIDIVSVIEANMTTGAEMGLNQSLQAIQGLVMIAESYNKTLEGVNQTSQLLEAADRAYMGYWTAGTSLAAGLPAVENTASTLNLSCNVFLPAIMKTYYDVVRAEVLLETLTNAYTNPPIDQADIATVVAASNVTGVGPLDPAIIVATYDITIQAGGPPFFNNNLAANIASMLAWQGLVAGGVPQEAQLFYNITVGVWKQAVGSGDDRQVILNAPDLEIGQLALLDKLSTLATTLKPTVARSVGDALLTQLPAPAILLANATINAIIASNCTVSDEVLMGGLSNFLMTQGVDPNAAPIIARDLYYGNYTKETALQLAIATVKSQATQIGITVPEALFNALADLIQAYDANATGTLTGSLKYGVAALLAAQSANVTLTDDVKNMLLSSTSLEEATLNVARVTVTAMGGDQAAGMLEMLASAGLLGKSKAVILNSAPQLLAEAMANMPGMPGNITAEQAQALIAEAIKVYQGVLPFDQAVGELVNESLKEAFPKILEELKGVMVEKDANGFIIGLNATGDTLDDRVNTAQTIKKDLLNGLKSLGYDATVILGGNDYMTYEMRVSAQEDIQKSDRLSMIFVIVILGLIMESIVAVFLPFIGIGFGLVVSLAIAYLLGNYGIIDVTTHSRTIMFTTGLGLGIDYAAYVSRRFREAASKGLESREAAVEAYRKSLRPVMAGAFTAMIGFGSMMLAWDFPFVSSIGTNVPLTIFAVMIASITFIPALLAYVGEKRWFWWPRHPLENAGKTPKFMRVGKAITGKPAIPLALALLLALFAGYVMVGFTGSYDMALNLPTGSESRLALEYINNYYDPGVLYPVYVVASSKDKANQILDTVKQLSCVAKADILDGYQDRVVRLVMEEYPLSKAGVDCVSQIRSEVHKIDEGSLVGGMSAINLDLKNLINDRFYHRVYPVAITLMFLTFLVAYGGVVTALSAIISVILAAYAGSALTIVIFQGLMGRDVMWYLPVIVFTAILGVGMDYNSFYIARAREECSEECSKAGVAKSIAFSTPTVLGLASIMAGAYVGLALASSPGLSTMGTALIFGVLLAGINASLILTPPLIAILGKASWWPRYPKKGGS